MPSVCAKNASSHVGEQFHHVPEVVHAVVDRCGRQQIQLLRSLRTRQHLGQLAIPRRLLLALARKPGVTEVVGLVDDDDVRLLPDAVHHRRPVHVIRLVAREVRVIDDLERQEPAQQFRTVVLDRRLPDRLATRLRHDQRHAPSIVHDQPFEQHEADERLAETHAVAQETHRGTDRRSAAGSCSPPADSGRASETPWSRASPVPGLPTPRPCTPNPQTARAAPSRTPRTAGTPSRADR